VIDMLKKRVSEGVEVNNTLAVSFGLRGTATRLIDVPFVHAY
jgi:hypothetical protein